jgi:hypothetical protein
LQESPLNKHNEKVLEIILDGDEEYQPQKTWKFNIQKIMNDDEMRYGQDHLEFNFN